jgi:hypothetical protein
MPHYHFNIVNDVERPDKKGLHLPNVTAARAHAKRLAGALSSRGTTSMLPLQLVVTNGEGELLFRMAVPLP